MDVLAADVFRELKALRKGFGLEDPSATTRIGPALRFVSGVAGDDGPAAQRRKIGSYLLRMTETLPESMARASRLALVLDGGSDGRFESRLHQMALEFGCDPRTARRHVDDSLKYLAEEALSNPLPEAQGRRDIPWHLERLKALVLFAPPVIEVLEERHIVSHQDDLLDIAHSYSLAPPRDGTAAADPADLQIDVLHGGIQQAREQWSATRAGIRVRLPRPLKRCQGHDVTLRVILNGTSVPFYVCTPRYPCARFELTVRFGRVWQPSRVWLIDNELPLEAGDLSRCHSQVDLDEAGEATVSFAGLEANRSYGLGWSSSSLSS